MSEGQRQVLTFDEEPLDSEFSYVYEQLPAGTPLDVMLSYQSDSSSISRVLKNLSAYQIKLIGITRLMDPENIGAVLGGSVEELRLAETKISVEAVAPMLARLARLRALTLESCELPFAAFRSVAACSSIESLELIKTKLPAIPLESAPLAVGQKTVKIVDVQITLAQIAGLDLDNVQKLTLQKCGIDDFMLGQIVFVIKKVPHLNLSRNSLTQGAVSALLQLDAQHLNASFNEISDWKPFAALVQLKTLNLTGNPLREAPQLQCAVTFDPEKKEKSARRKKRVVQDHQPAGIQDGDIIVEAPLQASKEQAAPIANTNDDLHQPAQEEASTVSAEFRKSEASLQPGIAEKPPAPQNVPPVLQQINQLTQQFEQSYDKIRRELDIQLVGQEHVAARISVEEDSTHQKQHVFELSEDEPPVPELQCEAQTHDDNQKQAEDAPAETNAEVHVQPVERVDAIPANYEIEHGMDKSLPDAEEEVITFQTKDAILFEVQATSGPGAHRGSSVSAHEDELSKEILVAQASKCAKHPARMPARPKSGQRKQKPFEDPIIISSTKQQAEPEEPTLDVSAVEEQRIVHGTRVPTPRRMRKSMERSRSGKKSAMKLGSPIEAKPDESKHNSDILTSSILFGANGAEIAIYESTVAAKESPKQEHKTPDKKTTPSQLTNGKLRASVHCSMVPIEAESQPEAPAIKKEPNAVQRRHPAQGGAQYSQTREEQQYMALSKTRDAAPPLWQNWLQAPIPAALVLPRKFAPVHGASEKKNVVSAQELAFQIQQDFEQKQQGLTDAALRLSQKLRQEPAASNPSLRPQPCQTQVNLTLRPHSRGDGRKCPQVVVLGQTSGFQLQTRGLSKSSALFSLRAQ